MLALDKMFRQVLFSVNKNMFIMEVIRMLKYKINVLESLKEAGYNTYYLKVNNVLGQQTLSNIRNGKIVGPKTLDQLCSMLKCQPGDILEWVEDEGQANRD